MQSGNSVQRRVVERSDLTTHLIAVCRFQVFMILPSMILPPESLSKMIEGKMMKKDGLRMLFNGSWLRLSGVRVNRAGRE